MNPKLKAWSMLGAAIAILSTNGAASAQSPSSWELSGEFNPSNNANVSGQVWTYGRQLYSNPPQAVANFLALTPGSFFGPLQGWKSGAGWAPAVYQNTSSAVYALGQSNVPIHGVVLLPGFLCERAAVRFTPPAAGTYRVSGQFWGMNYAPGPLDSSVYIRRVVGNTPTTVFSGVISTANQMQQAFTSKSIALNAADKLDFEVGCGPSGAFPFGLLTGIHAVVERTSSCAPNGPPCD